MVTIGDSRFSLPPALACALILSATATHGDEPDYVGDVTDVRTIRRVEQHPQAWRLWQPVIIQGTKRDQLLVAFGAMRNGKKDMGDIFVTLSKDDGDTWEEPVAVFDHTQRQGAIQFAYANPVLYRVPGQAVIWCFAMRCSIAQRNSEESQLAAAFTADDGRSWKPVEMAMDYTGPLILNAAPVKTNIDGKTRFLLPAHRNTLAADPRGSRAKSKGFFGRSAGGTHIYVYNDGPAQRDTAPGFPSGGRTSLRYKVKPPGGQWSEQKTFYHADIKNSYPTLFEVALGSFRCVWDSGTADRPRTHIHFGKLRIAP